MEKKGVIADAMGEQTTTTSSPQADQVLPPAITSPNQGHTLVSVMLVQVVIQLACRNRKSLAAQGRCGFLGMSLPN
jgi:hypothetical protein